ncbi:hypothetical protein [Paraburkholderia hospita]|uniref:hypothetical protein n=1 Tax=Paraburkholderia hospita TaxID=169430 RepID=UPI0008A7A173|nr:hypothetical protein [Paraburkholderia hospita]SEH89066.1 hypothetical protein SAMN05192544_101196 [Paraburkholderia hospita]
MSIADNLEAEYLAVANGEKKPGKIDLETLVRAVQVLRAIEPENAELRAELARRQAEEKGEVWYWQHDGNDHPESLACQVMIKADHLRELIGVVKPSAPDITLPGFVRQQRDAARKGLQMSEWTSEETAQRLLNALAALHEPAGVLFQHDDTGRTTFVDAPNAESFEHDNERWSRVGEAALIRSYKELV